MFRLNDMAAQIGFAAIGNDPIVTSLACSTQKLLPGALFVAISGTKTDGHYFLDEAFKKGAVAAVVTDATKLGNYPGIVVKDSRAALSKLAKLFYKDPTAASKVIGITGTNGKTTVNWLLYHALNKLNLNCIRIGTLGIAASGLLDQAATLTTPDTISLNHYLSTAVMNGFKSAVIETSSHALDQKRVEDFQFDVGVFTNLTRDHLDYHTDEEDYFKAKFRLFEILAESLKETKSAVVNADDQYGILIRNELQRLGLRDLSFGWANGVIRISDFQQNLSGSQFKLYWEGKEQILSSTLIGRHNAENLTAAFASLLALNFAPADIAKVLQKSPQVPGRLERVGAGTQFGVYVDYAHTPDALANVLRTLRPLCKGRLIVLFGCGGDRDKGKRPIMANVAAELADDVVVTSDNPRTEDPASIITDILACGIKARFTDIDRRKAILETVLLLKPGDILLVAGKGHENYQIIGENKSYFSDQEEVLRALEQC